MKLTLSIHGLVNIVTGIVMLARTSLYAFRNPSRTLGARPFISPHILRCSRNSPSFRVFTSTPRHRKDVNRIPEHVPTKSVRPVLVQKEDATEQNATGKQDGLLAEKVTSNVEQRKADWAIMKEMTKYLWPKVHIQYDTVKSPRLTSYTRIISVPDSALDSPLVCW